jgi:deoxyribodipyrimidine photo-lyase
MPGDLQQAAGCLIGRDYPPPLVDHAAAVREAKRRLAAVRSDPEARDQARGVARRHGSRRDRRGAMQQDPVRRSLAREAGQTASRPPRQPDPQRLLPFLDADSADQAEGTRLN